MSKRLTIFSLVAVVLSFGVVAVAEPIGANAVKSASSLEFTASTSLFDAEGTFHSWKVSGKVDPDEFEKSDVRVVIDAASIDTDNGKRDEHLRSEDFFHVSKHKHLTFETRSIRKTGEGRYEVTGRFTIIDNSKTVTVPVTVSREKADGKPVLRVRGDLTVDRFDYGLDYEAGFFTPDLDRNVELRFNLAFALD